MVDYDQRQRLIEVPQSGQTISYSELRPDAPQTLAAPPDEINKHGHQEARPLLSAVVTHKNGDRTSANGFFKIAWELGQYKEGDPEQYWRQELERVWQLPLMATFPFSDLPTYETPDTPPRDTFQRSHPFEHSIYGC